jgi:hypothetical protein
MIFQKIFTVNFLLLILLLSISSMSMAIEKPDNYCDDQESWLQWKKLLIDNPDNDGISSLYAFRIGLCSMVKSGEIETKRATKLFEGFRDVVIRQAEEAEMQSVEEKGI